VRLRPFAGVPLAVRGALVFLAAVALSFALVRPFASAEVTTPPGAPVGVVAKAGAGSATLSWTAPDDGGSPITSYAITPYAGSVAQAPTTVSGSPPWPTATVTGLRDGITYSFTVTAANAVGSGPPSAPATSSGPSTTRSAMASATPSASSEGQWAPSMNWPMVAIHSVLLDTGQVLQFDGWQQPEPTQVWDPSTGTFTNQTAPDSIFCSGMAQLPDGRVIVVGGYGLLTTGQLGIVDTNIFDPSTSQWTRVADMHSPRWYPSLTELADGRYVVISGIKTQTTTNTTWADTPEVYDPSSNTWAALSSISTSQVHEQEYPFSYLIPNGNVFTIAPTVDKSFELNVKQPSWTQVGGSSGVLNGSSVMYRPGEILYSGGAADAVADNVPAMANTAVIDLNASKPQWRTTAPLANARIYHTLTMLADGTVLAVGGEPNSGTADGKSEVSGGVLPSEIWDPNTETWSPAADTAVTRGYHSTAILMPDGTVLVAGSGHSGPAGEPGQLSAQIYSPPYLFKGPRPTLSSAPTAAAYGSTISISTPDAASISTVNLVSLGTDTHQSDMQQHFVPLSFTQGAGGLNVQIPSSAAVAPPGNYMLFIVNSTGVPSVASFINVSGDAPAPTAPGAPTGVSAVAGDGSAAVSWNAPNDGGDPINSYTITPYVGTYAQPATVVTGTPPSTGATVSGLANGTTYTFTVTAANAVGSGPESLPSAAVAPASAPGTTSTSSSSSPPSTPVAGSGTAGSSTAAPGPRAPVFQAGFFTLSAPQVTSRHALVFKLDAPSAGTFTATATTALPAIPGGHTTRRGTTRYATGSAPAAGPGLVRLVLSPSSAARAALAHGARLAVKVSVTFRSRRGTSLTRTIHVPVVGRQRRATGCIASSATSAVARSAACRSLVRTSAITARARARFAAEALQKILPANLFFCVHSTGQLGQLPLSSNWTAWWIKTRAPSTGRSHA
jgi:Domain of unknown function (DUF1929)/Fibronectin type III domain/Glyoxal oxidase N-terminus